MKLEQILSISEDQNLPVKQLVNQQFLGLMFASLKEIPSELDYDLGNESIDYAGLMDHKTSLFDSSGKCMVENIDDIFAYAKHEKVEVIVGGYDGNWEDFFISPKADTMIVKRAAHSIPGEDEHVVVRFKGHTFALTRPEFEATLEEFVDNKHVEYERIKDLKSRDDYDDEDYRPRRRYYHNEYPNHWDDPEPTIDDYNFTTETMYGGLLYKNLQHV